MNAIAPTPYDYPIPSVPQFPMVGSGIKPGDLNFGGAGVTPAPINISTSSPSLNGANTRANHFGVSGEQMSAWEARNPLGKMVFGKDGSMNLEGIGTLIQGIGSFGSLWSAMETQKLAKESLAHQIGAFNKNYNNSVQSYNTALEDRINSRISRNGGTSADAESYINRHKLG
jgi:hypothetical protein